MRSLLLLLFFAPFTSAAFGQDSAQVSAAAPAPAWKREIKLAINATQAAFSTNFVGGGVNSLGLGTQFQMKGARDGGRPWTLDYEILLEYGIQQIRGQSMRKTLDRIWLDGKVARKIAPHWAVFAGANLLTQFDAGFQFGQDAQNRETRLLLSRLFAPAYLGQQLGIEYKPVDYFWARLGLGSSRVTFVLDENVYRGAPTAFGVPFGKQVRWEGGLQLNSDFKKEIAKNISLQMTLYMFTPYTGDSPLKNIDTRFDAAFVAKVNSWLTVTLSGTALYFKDQAPEWQTAQFLALNFLLIDKQPADAK